MVSFAIVTLAFAKGVVRWLRTGAFPQDAWLPDAYVPGETFPKVLRGRICGKIRERKERKGKELT